MFNWIDKKTQLLTRKVLHGCPRRLRPPALELFRQQSTLGKIGKEEPWTLEIISYWSDKLSSILDYFTFDPQKKVFYQFSARVRCYLFITSSNPRASPSSEVLASLRPRVPASPRPRVPASPRPRVPASPRPTSPLPRPTLSDSLNYGIIVAGDVNRLNITPIKEHFRLGQIIVKSPTRKDVILDSVLTML